MPQLKKAELIEGVVFVTSAVPFDRHGEQHADLIGWLGSYRINTPDVRVGSNSSLRLDLENEPQPDAVLVLNPASNRRVRISTEGYLEGSPELLAEVASSRASIELHDKLRVYRRNQVQEYLVWRVLDQAVDWFVLRSDHYERLALNASGFYASEVFPGLWLDPAALVRGDAARVHQVLQQGLASPEHAAFVARLQQAAEQRS